MPHEVLCNLIKPVVAGNEMILFTLNELPEEPYPEPVWNEKVDAVWAFILTRRHVQSEEMRKN